MASPPFPTGRSFWRGCLPSELHWLSKQLRPLLCWHLVSFVCIATSSIISLVPPLALGWLIDKVLPGREGTPLLGIVALLFVSYQGRTLLTSLGGFLTLTAAQRLALGLRMSVVRHLDTLSADYYEYSPIGRVIYPLQEPIEEIAYFGSDLFPSILRLLLTVLFTLTAMFALSPRLTLAVLPLIPAFLLTRQHFRQKLATASDTVQKGQTAWADFLHEHFSAVIPIQLLGQESRQERRAFRLLASVARSQQSLFKAGVYFSVFTSLSIVLAISVAVGYGGWSVFTGGMSAGNLVALYSFAAQLFEPLSSAAEIYARAQKTFANIRQVQKVFELCPAISESPSAICLSEPGSFQLEVRGAEFRYRNQRTRLRIPSLRILPGEQVVVVGANGAGKSTLAKLFARIYDLDLGSICIGGEDIRNIQLDNLRRNVCYLPRDPVLFQGSLASNLRFVRATASNDELEAALRHAGLSAFLATLDDGLRQEIGPAGCRLSGGEGQRVAIARAMLQRPRILILDEATSCLDPVSEQLVLHNVRRHLRASTILVVSHRLSTVAGFPRVLVLSAGRIVEDGSPDQLGSSSGAFARLFSSDDFSPQRDHPASRG